MTDPADAIPDDREDLVHPLVLVGFDGTDKDLAALRWAIDTANALDATVEVVHAVGMLESWRSGGLGPIADQLSVPLKRTIIEVGGPHPPDLELRLLAGPPAEVLLEEVARCRPMILVVGRGVPRGSHTTALGSVSRTVVDRCPVPVAVVPSS